MNRKQKAVAVVGTALVCLMMAYPPWTEFRKSDGKNLGSAGYHFFDSPPEPASTDPYSDQETGFSPSGSVFRIDRNRQAVQMAIVGLLSMVGILILANPPEENLAQ